MQVENVKSITEHIIWISLQASPLCTIVHFQFLFIYCLFSVYFFLSFTYCAPITTTYFCAILCSAQWKKCIFLLTIVSFVSGCSYIYMLDMSPISVRFLVLCNFSSIVIIALTRFSHHRTVIIVHCSSVSGCLTKPTRINAQKIIIFFLEYNKYNVEYDFLTFSNNMLCNL